MLADHGFGDPNLPEYEREAVEIEIKYSGFIQRQEKQVEIMRAKASKRLPEDIDYSTITALSMEAREKLAKVGPGVPVSVVLDVWMLEIFARVTDSYVHGCLGLGLGGCGCSFIPACLNFGGTESSTV